MAGQREREGARGKERRRQLWPKGQRERERSERAGWRRQVGPACQTQRAHGPGRAGGGGRLNGPTWAELAFSIFLEFLLPFLFIFSRVFNSNSNHVSNSNQIKYVQQFKEYLGSI
jgi:hypothetical protein